MIDWIMMSGPFFCSVLGARKALLAERILFLLTGLN